MDPGTVGKVADATKAIAETTGKGIDAAVSLGRVLLGPLTPILDTLEARGDFYRWEQTLKLSDRAQAIMRARGIEAPTRELPMKFALPLLNKATLEEDDDLRDTWARLLVNAGDASTPMELRTAYVAVLSELSAFDVRNLAQLTAASLADPVADRPYLPVVKTWDLPESAAIYEDSGMKEESQMLSPELLLSLGNLFRAGCIAPGGGWGGVALFTTVTVTGFGRALYQACS